MLIEVTPMLAFRHTNKKDNGIIDRLIRKVIKLRTDSEFYHVELVLDNKWISVPDMSGVTINSLRELDHTEWTYYNLKPIEVTSEQYANIWKFIRQQDGKNYDVAGIFMTQLVKLGISHSSKWFCSELSSKILQLLNYPEYLDVTPSEMSPAMMHAITVLSGAKEYKGNVPTLMDS